jgi:hypothetical protein
MRINRLILRPSTQPKACLFAAFFVACGMTVAASTQAALSSPFIPARGKGRLEVLTRTYSSGSRFPFSHIDESTTIASAYWLKQIRVDGAHGLGAGWALEYELRAGEAERIKGGGNNSVSGLGDQQVRFVHGMTRKRDFADALGITFVIPSASRANGLSLGTGQLAIGPELQFEVRSRSSSHSSFAALSAGMLYYFGDEGRRLQVRSSVGARLSPAATLTCDLRFRKALSGVNLGRALVRGDIRIHFGSRNEWGPVIGYETDLAGRDIRQGSSFIIGLSRRY